MEIVHLRAGDCSLVLDVGGPRLPTVLHWGADLGDATPASQLGLTLAETLAVAVAALDEPASRSLVREHSAGYLGRPTLSGHRMGSDWSPSFALTGLEHSGDDRVTVHGVDPVARLGLRSEIELSPSGLLRLRHTLRNEGDSPYVVNELLCALPLPGQATELLDLSGRWCRERHPQRHPLELGSWVRENRRGRTGHDATIGLVAGTPGFGFRHGEVWAVHVGWSGNHVSYAGRWPSGDAVLGGGKLLLPGEVSLAPAEEYATPWLYAAYSRTASTVSPPRSMATCGGGRTIQVRTGRAPSCSTPGRRSTSTTTSIGCEDSPAPPPRSASNGSFSTTAGSGPGATTPRVSATGTSTRRCGHMGWSR